MSTYKIKIDNKIFQDLIDFEILRSIINYLLTSKKNKKKNSTNNSNTISKKWYNFISLTISNNIINNNFFEHWLKINNNKSFIENYNNQNQYDKNNLIFNNKGRKQYKISFNKEFSIIKIKESIINDYFKFNLFLNNITIYVFKEIKYKFENNQLLYNRIVVNMDTNYGEGNKDEILFKIHKYVSNENSEIILNLFKILELNHDFMITHLPGSEEVEDEGNKKCTEFHLNNLSICCFDRCVGEDRKTLKIFKNFKGKNIIYDGPNVTYDITTYIDYSVLFDPDTSGQQVESIKVKNEYEDCANFVEARHLIKVNQFENLHSIKIPLNSFQILSNLSEELGFDGFDCFKSDFGYSDNMKSELNQMINSFITSKSIKNLKITSIISTEDSPIEYHTSCDESNIQTFINNINESKESFSNSFKPLFSELNTSIERIEFDCMGLLNINTFSKLLNNKSIKYLYLYDSDFIFYSLKPTGGDSDDDDDDDGDGGSAVLQETISINQYLFENIFSSPLTSIRHYKINFKESKQLKFIFNLILNNIFKLQLYSLIFVFNDNELIGEFVKEFRNLINNISTQQQQKSNNINLKEIKIEMYDENYFQELNNINSPYFKTVIKNYQY
ncbi:hypothetical protein DDB_G0271434 [Dictyostelium discoideum AX4]|uniref:Uncharacterized protein n=1 Tax=Dictyostelium discoideum TaxID=44689 RepID=Q55B56_DICDI|nr:hypothetical protein DDB_G0271434 [Dictyostelium discoideum AX4]EAL71847.1 hypothetical protein DDB_G0271434 [Dictyostelium discoideum AX4]|eukprot:XP_645756.1 hypothetical protein DDB_G0271434 [Dictyostelium discoideum AX4]